MMDGWTDGRLDTGSVLFIGVEEEGENKKNYSRIIRSTPRTSKIGRRMS